MIKLNPKRIYYIAHPATSCGDYWDNIKSEMECVARIIAANGYIKKEGLFKKTLISEIGLIRPLNIIPAAMTDHDLAMDICFGLLDQVAKSKGGLILCGNWEQSRGCLMEKEYVERLGLEVLTFEEVVNG